MIKELIVLIAVGISLVVLFFNMDAVGDFDYIKNYLPKLTSLPKLAF